MENHFELSFGKLPTNFLGRGEVINNIVENFSYTIPISNLYVISGARGAGKTVLLNKIYDIFENDNTWVTVKINPERDIIEQIASHIYENEKVKHLFIKPSFSYSFHGITFSLEGKTPITNSKSLLEKMLAYLKKHNKKLLIAIDEVNNSKEMKAFAHDFQSLLGDGYNIYLLMTGLYENISSLQNNKSLTFLYRAPKIFLKPLDLIDIYNSYKKVFKKESDETIKQLTFLTNGYAYAYQLLGTLFSAHKVIDDTLINEFDESLKNYCYDIIYQKIAPSELKLLYIIPDNGSCTSKYIVENTDMSIKEISVLKDRLIKRGILKDKKGEFTIVLPRFRKYLNNVAKFLA